MDRIPTWFVWLLGSVAVFAGSLAAELTPLLDPGDLPPAPVAAGLGELTHSQIETQRIIGGLDLTSTGNDADEQALTGAVVDLKARLEGAVEKAYRTDPTLLLSDTYQEKAHDWVTTKHNDEFNASFKFAGKLNKDAQKQVNDAVDLIDMILFKELARNPNFEPLFASLYDAAGQMAKTNKAMSNHLFNFQRNDKLIGYSAEPRAEPVVSLENYLGELDKRYPLLLAKLDERKRDGAIPDAAFAGLKFGELYRLLDGIAQMSVMIRTPEEVSDLRKTLRTKVIQLVNLRGKQKQAK